MHTRWNEEAFRLERLEVAVVGDGAGNVEAGNHPAVDGALHPKGFADVCGLHDTREAALHLEDRVSQDDVGCTRHDVVEGIKGAANRSFGNRERNGQGIGQAR